MHAFVIRNTILHHWFMKKIPPFINGDEAVDWIVPKSQRGFDFCRSARSKSTIYIWGWNVFPPFPTMFMPKKPVVSKCPEHNPIWFPWFPVARWEIPICLGGLPNPGSQWLNLNYYLFQWRDLYWPSLSVPEIHCCRYALISTTRFGSVPQIEMVCTMFNCC